VAPTSLVEQVVEQIKNRILEGTLKRGARLPSERELAQQFAVSRTTVRQALKLLEQMGLVEIRVGAAGGARVTVPTPETVASALALVMHFEEKPRFKELLEARRVVELATARLAAERASQEDVLALRDLAQQMAEALEQPAAFTRADVEFHLALARVAQNRILESFLRSTEVLLYQMIGELAQVVDLRSEGLRHHRALVQAVADHAPQEAERAMRAHFGMVDSALDVLIEQGGRR